MALLLIISLFVGATLAEIAIRVYAGLRSSNRLPEIMALLRAFRQADGDDARQALLIRTGLATLKLSVMSLGLFVGLAVLAWLPPWTLAWSGQQQVAYFVASSVMAALWWFFRRTSYVADHAE